MVSSGIINQIIENILQIHCTERMVLCIIKKYVFLKRVAPPIILQKLILPEICSVGLKS